MEIVTKRLQTLGTVVSQLEGLVDQYIAPEWFRAACVTGWGKSLKADKEAYDKAQALTPKVLFGCAKLNADIDEFNKLVIAFVRVCEKYSHLTPSESQKPHGHHTLLEIVTPCRNPL